MYLWSKLSAKKWEDAWEERFYGNTNAVIEEIKGGKSVRVQVYCQTEAEAEEIQAQFGGSIREVKSATWQEPQDLTRKPLLIRDKVVLTQTVIPEEFEALKQQYPERAVINIPAEMAFGTGDHPTTATCLRYLCDYTAERGEKSWEMADAGCGTGVIAIAGHFLGARSVEAFDFDEHAVRVAKKNIELNNASGIEACVMDVFEWQAKQKFDLIVANLFSTVLQQVFPVLKSALKEHGEMIISGILASQWEQTRDAAEGAGLMISDYKGRKWITARVKISP